MPSLFSPFSLRDVTLRNRICVSPMCQYSAQDGIPTDWHLVHLGARAIGGAALVIAEATAVSPEGRITPGCTGLWSSAHAEKFGRIAHFIKAQGAVPGIQLAHAGRKASAHAPWRGQGNLPESDPDAWQPIGPSAIPFGAALTRVPSAMTKADIARVQSDFASAARRALEAGFEWLELHFAHGYLGQSFFSPIANHRDDQYGGSFEGRARFALETFAAVRAVWRLKSIGLDVIDPSLGGNSPDVSGVPYGPAFMVPIADRVKREVAIAAAVSWQITEPQQAESIIRDGQTDLVLLARAMLDDPHWPFHAARMLGRRDYRAVLPPQYHRVI